MMANYFKTSLGFLRLTAFVEGMSYLVILFITMPMKYLFDMPEPTRPVGMAHGVLFIMYVALVLLVQSKYKWSLKTTFWALLASIIPFGTFVADSKIFKKSKNQ